MRYINLRFTYLLTYKDIYMIYTGREVKSSETDEWWDPVRAGLVRSSVALMDSLHDDHYRCRNAGSIPNISSYMVLAQ